MARVPVIGLVGGIGAGKSTVANELARLGCRVIDADRVGHEVLRRPEVRDRVAEIWGAGVIGSDGEVDRRALGRIVFRDDGGRADYDRLMELSHPILWHEVRRRLDEARAESSAGVVLDAALLFESGLDRLCDAVVCVTADRAVREARLAAGRGWSPADLERRERYQKSLEFKLENSDYTADNSQSAEQTTRQVREIFRQITGRCGDDAGGDPP
jgi:dephospho-CoA kinase